MGNSYVGALALAFTIAQPQRVSKPALMGSVGGEFPLTEGLHKTWGYQPSIENMKRLISIREGRST